MRTKNTLATMVVAMMCLYACGSSSGSEESQDSEEMVTATRSGIAAPANPTFPQSNFLGLSDMHFNPFYDPTLIQDLIKTDAAQWDTVFEKSSVKGYGSYFWSGPFIDTGYPLFKSALAEAKAVNPNPAFITVNGDFLAHEFESNFQTYSGTYDLDSLQDFTIKTLEYIVGKIDETFPNSPLFGTLGNNDAFCGDYEIRTPGSFLNRSAPLFLKQLKGSADSASFNKTFKEGGYYSATDPENPNHKIISLNTVIMSPKHFEKEDFCGGAPSVSTIKPKVDAQFAWLESELQDAVNNNQTVWILVHVPPGFDSWGTHKNNQNLPASQCQNTVPSSFYDLDFNTQYLSIIDQYQSVITAQLGGHTHMDNFMVINGDSNPSSFVHIQPSFSPINGNNPGFIEYSFDSGSGIIKDYEVHGLLNVETPATARWTAEYTFSQAYNQSELTPQTLAKVYQNFLTDSLSRQRYLEYYVVEDSTAAPSMNEWEYYYCAFGNQTVKDYNDCICKLAN